jgi:hypothetical protein
LETHLLIDYEKAYNSIQRMIVLDILKSIDTAHTLLKAVVDIIHTKPNINKM